MMLVIRASPNTEVLKLRHNWVSRAFLTVWIVLKSSGCALPQHAHALLESDWLRLLELCAKLGVLSFKVRVLSLQRANLLRQQRRLLLKQVDHVLAESDGASKANNFFGGVECAHKVNWPKNYR